MSIFSGHPKGLFIAFFANMGERFGFYTMMAILVLFLQAKFGLNEETAGGIYSAFYFSIYILALVGGLIADSIQKYRKVILLGVIIMTLGYVIMAVPGLGLPFVVIGLFVIAFGNGLFKGNLQALVGKLYDKPEYEHLRDSAFNVFYMGINVGAFFAPSAAIGIRNWWLSSKGFAYDGTLPSLCHKFINGEAANTGVLQELANKVSLSGPVTDLNLFAQNYIDAFSVGYNCAFGIAAGAMVVSFLIFIFFQKYMAYADNYQKKDKGLVSFKNFTPEEKERMKALGLVFVVVIFFWMSFHQNGLTLLFFARDYTAKTVGAFDNLWFDLRSLLSVIAAIGGLVLLIQKNSKALTRIIGLALAAVGGYLANYFYNSFPEVNHIHAEIFEQFNPVFIVFLTPLVLAFFAFLNKRKMEPSTPRKIGIGMIITAISFGIMLIGSIGVAAPQLVLNHEVGDQNVSVYLLIGTYLMLTIAELFLSPIGVSFVSKVAPERFKGLMQGGWLGATAIGNALLFVGSTLYGDVVSELWYLWAFFAVCCIISAVIIFSKMKFLEKVTSSATEAK